jgi:hypothetical protein
MRFYPFHVGDYLSHTRHLSLLEDLAYRRMLDAYYLHEQALVGTPAEIARAIGLRVPPYSPSSSSLLETAGAWLAATPRSPSTATK